MRQDQSLNLGGAPSGMVVMLCIWEALTWAIGEQRALSQSSGQLTQQTSGSVKYWRVRRVGVWGSLKVMGWAGSLQKGMVGLWNWEYTPARERNEEGVYLFIFF